MTAKCNLRCKHCYNTEYSMEELSTNNIKKIIEQSKKYVEVYQILGGEPFLRKDIWEIMDYLTIKNANFTIITNGTLLDENKIRRLFTTNLKEIVISIESTNQKINDNIRGKGTYDSVINFLEVMNSIDPQSIKIKRHISVTIQKLNLYEEEKLLQFCDKNHISSALFVPVEISGNAKNNKEIVEITNEEWMNFLERLCFISNKYQVKLNFPGTPILKEYFIKKYKAKLIKPYSFKVIDNVFRNLYIRADGSIYPTFKYKDINLISGENLKQENFNNIFQSENFKKYRKIVMEYNKKLQESSNICLKCPYLNICSLDVNTFMLYHDSIIKSCEYVAERIYS